jgi:hypothetical protein
VQLVLCNYGVQQLHVLHGIKNQLHMTVAKQQFSFNENMSICLSMYGIHLQLIIYPCTIFVEMELVILSKI